MDIINLDSVDEWLENDLRQLGIILPPATNSFINTSSQSMMASPPISECTPRMDHLLELTTPTMKYEPLSPLDTPKADSKDSNKPPMDVQSFIKALTILGTIQQLKAPQPQKPNDVNTTNINKPSSLKRDRNSINNSDLTNEQSPQDLIALKRQRNTDAARRSRLRKAMKMESLEKRVMDLEAENERLKLRAAVAESERANVEAKEKSNRVRILELERQLADTHNVLVRYSQQDSTL
ncbi:MAG: hypothetical protein EXX96DRAFT_487074 [Benjaminiella poitrasii]|nr:MAG: hypothetical protein EXX96DRAFT_487074 [Benjaminiella poitrasii]